jgi:hypothetical protein
MRYRIRELDFNDGVNKPIYMAEASRGWLLPWHPIGQWEEAKLYSLMDIKRFKKENGQEKPRNIITRLHRYEGS